MNKGRLHELPSQRDLISGVAEFSHTLMRPDELAEVLAHAFTIFRCKRPRPVHIEIPIDVLLAAADQASRKTLSIMSRPAPCMTTIQQAVTMLQVAKNPVICLGGGAVDVGEEIVRLVELIDAPTLLTQNAKGILPPQHPLSVGSLQSTTEVRDLIKASDVMLAIGTELSETDYDIFFQGGFDIPGKLIRIDIDPAQLNTNFIADIGIVSDASLAVKALIDKLDIDGVDVDPDDSPGSRRTAAVLAKLEPQWDASYRAQRKLLEIIQSTLPGVIIAGDSTQSVYTGCFSYTAERPRSWFHSATGYGTLGYGLPAAIGAKIGIPERPVVALVGDGGIQFTLNELASAVEAKASIVIVLWNNQGYGEIKKYMQSVDISPIGVDLYTPDFIKIAEGMGCRAAQADSFEHVTELLSDASQHNRPLLIEIREDADFLIE